MSPQLAFAAALPTLPHEPWIHDPSTRSLVTRIGAWEVRILPPRPPQARRPNRRSELHIQLWHPRLRVSVITPNRLTADRFEVQLASKRTWRMARTAALHPFVTLLSGGDLPPMREIAMLTEWYGRSRDRHGRRRPQTTRLLRAPQRPGSQRRVSAAAGGFVASDLLPTAASNAPVSSPLDACLVSTLRHLITYLAIVDAVAVQRFFDRTPLAAAGTNLCQRIVAVLSMAMHSEHARRELNRLLAQRLRVASAPFEQLSLSELADFWTRDSSHLNGTPLAALLWVVAQRSDPCNRKLEAKISRRIDLNARWALLDAADWP